MTGHVWHAKEKMINKNKKEILQGKPHGRLGQQWYEQDFLQVENIFERMIDRNK